MKNVQKKVHQDKISDCHISDDDPVDGDFFFQGNGIGAEALPFTINPEMKLLGVATSTLLS